MSLCILRLNNVYCLGSALLDDSDNMAHELTWLLFFPNVAVYGGPCAIAFLWQGVVYIDRPLIPFFSTLVHLVVYDGISFIRVSLIPVVLFSCSGCFENVHSTTKSTKACVLIFFLGQNSRLNSLNLMLHLTILPNVVIFCSTSFKVWFVKTTMWWLWKYCLNFLEAMSSVYASFSIFL